MADDNPKEWPTPNGVVPHSITYGPSSRGLKLYVTTSNSTILVVDPNDPGSAVPKTSTVPELSAGIVPDPRLGADGRPQPYVWFASPAKPEKVDPIYSMDVRNDTLHSWALENNARAENIVVVPHPGVKPAETRYELVFAEPVNGYLGSLDLVDGSKVQTRGDAIRPTFNTWPVVVAARTVDSGRSYVYWVAGQATGSFTDHGLYYLDTDGKGWQRKGTRLPGQSPLWVLADETSLWVSLTNPNMVARWDFNDQKWTEGKIATEDVPGQLVFGADRDLWVAAGARIYRLDKQSLDVLNRVQVPNNGSAKGLVLDAKGTQIWYTDPTNKSIGRYLVPAPGDGGGGAGGVRGRTQVVDRGDRSVRVGGTTVDLMQVEYVADGTTVPGIPLTVSLDAEQATFADGSTEAVVITDALGRVVVPPVRAGGVAEQVVVRAGLGDVEDPVSVVLRVTP